MKTLKNNSFLLPISFCLALALSVLLCIAAAPETMSIPYQQTFKTEASTFDDNFQYKITPVKLNEETGQVTPIPIATGMPVPQGVTQQGDTYIWKLQGNAEGDLVFATKDCPAGLYCFQIKNSTESKGGYSYDNTTYVAKIYIGAEGDPETQTVALILNLDTGMKVSNMTFSHSYVEPGPEPKPEPQPEPQPEPSPADVLTNTFDNPLVLVVLGGAILIAGFAIFAYLERKKRKN